MSAQSVNIEELTHKIESSLDSIRPYLQADGGDVKVNDITPERIVKLEFVGNCGNCSMSTMTFKAGVEAALKRDVPEVAGIEVINLIPLDY